MRALVWKSDTLNGREVYKSEIIPVCFPALPALCSCLYSICKWATCTMRTVRTVRTGS
jgi:hypothetical protein